MPNVLRLKRQDCIGADGNVSEEPIGGHVRQAHIELEGELVAQIQGVVFLLPTLWVWR